jgi:hypothetical protein
MWVSEAPHLLGRFVKFDLKMLLADDFRPENEPISAIEAIDADPLLTNGGYAVWKLGVGR